MLFLLVGNIASTLNNVNSLVYVGLFIIGLSITASIWNVYSNGIFKNSIIVEWNMLI